MDFGRYRLGLKPGVLAAHGCDSSITIAAATNGSGGADGKADRRPAPRERAAERRHERARSQPRYGDGCLIRDRFTQTRADYRHWVHNEYLALTGVAPRASFDSWGWSPPKPPERADDSYRKRGTVGFDRPSEGGILLPKRAASDPASACCRMRIKEYD
jgi:hypothetical protein